MSVINLQTSPEHCEAAIIYLADCCDGANSEDGAGFNKYDADFGANLAVALEKWPCFTVKQLDAAKKLCWKYRRQLDEAGFDIDTMQEQIHHSEQPIETKMQTFETPITAINSGGLEKSVTHKENGEDAGANVNPVSNSNTKADDIASSPLLKLLKKPTKKSDDTRLLHGTGITKRIAEAAEKKFEADQVVASKHVNTIAALVKLQADKKFIFEQATEKFVEDAEVKSPVISLKPILQPSGDTDWQWDESQLAAIEGILENKYSCLIGAAGTGKTTVVKEIVSRVEDKVPSIDLAYTKIGENEKEEFNVAICFCAFTGRAVQQMKRPIPKKFHPMCNTIHATLGYAPVWDEILQHDGTYKKKVHFEPSFGSWRKLPYKVYILDETGMVPIYLWDQLLDAMLPDAKVIFVGDINQLPPVQGRSVLGFAMNKWPTYELTHIHRQAQESPIIENAHNILNGKFPRKVSEQFDMVRMPGGGLETADKVIKVLQILHQKNQFNELEDACIVPQNKDIIGQVNLNSTLVSYFNPEKTVSGAVVNKRMIIKTGIATVMFAVGDKVMLLANNRPKNLTNGMTGVIVEIIENGLYKKGDALDAEFNADTFMQNLAEGVGELNINTAPDEEEIAKDKESASQRQASHILKVKFEHQEVPFQTAGEYKLIAHAYAFTCHKSQGGEYPTVVILCHSANWRMLSREWLYTAITRAQKRVVLLFNDRGLSQALGTQRIKGKSLQDKINSFNLLQDQADVSIPTLPEPEKW